MLKLITLFFALIWMPIKIIEQEIPICRFCFLISMYKYKYISMLNHIQRRFGQYMFSIERRLYIHDSGPEYDTFNESGIRATVFGASGFLGHAVATRLGGIGSSVIMPVTSENNYRHSEHIKQLKVTGATNKSWVQWDADMRDQRFIEDMVSNSNVVINLLGPRMKVKKQEDFEFINIEAAQRIAKACVKKGVQRLIHFSAAGAEPDSQSLDFQTKYRGEEVVRKTFPNATIFRPSIMYGINDHWASVVQRQSLFFFHKFVFVYDDCTALKQPIREWDVAQCVINALKLTESQGKTYELGGPHVLSTLEMHEIIFNTLKVQPKLVYVNPDIAMKVAKYLYNWQFFGQEVIRKKKINQIVTGRYHTVEDLRLQPVSFKSGIFDIMREFIAKFYHNDVDNEN